MEDEDVQKRGEWPTMIVIIIHNHQNYHRVRSDWGFFCYEAPQIHHDNYDVKIPKSFANI